MALISACGRDYLIWYGRRSPGQFQLTVDGYSVLRTSNGGMECSIINNVCLQVPVLAWSCGFCSETQNFSVEQQILWAYHNQKLVVVSSLVKDTHPIIMTGADLCLVTHWEADPWWHEDFGRAILRNSWVTGNIQCTCQSFGCYYRLA